MSPNIEKFTEIETIRNPADCSAQEFIEPLVGIRFMTEADRPTVSTEAVEHFSVQQIYELLRLKHLDNDEISVVKEFITEAADIFHLPDEKLGATDVLVHRIPTIDEFPVNSKQYRFPVIHKDEINKQVQEQLEGGIIRKSSSPYNTPIWIVSKKKDSHGNKKWRLVLDFTELNKKTIADSYPLPNIVDILDQLGEANYFSVFDLASGFHQINMHSDDCPKTAFTTPYGHYEYVRMPMGLRNGPPTFQRLMDMVLMGMQGREVFVYLDDIVVYAKTLTKHNEKCRKVFDRLRKAKLLLQPDKCEFLKREVVYLGHIISKDGVKPNPEKVKAVREFPRPRNLKNIRQFLGLTGYYRRFIEGYAEIAKPLSHLLKDNVPFIWGNSEEKSFQDLKELLITEPVLIFPDFSKPFSVTTDTSGYAIGGILSQGPINQDRPVADTSRTLNTAEVRYDTYEKAALAIVYSVLHFRPYLYGRKFTLVTDHKPLLWFRTCKDGNARVLRWRLKLTEYEYDVVYKAGKANVNADALSRNPVEITEIEDTAEIFATCHEKKKKLTDEEIIKLLESEDEDGCSNASIQGDDISQNFLTEEPEAYEENREDAFTEKQLTHNAIQNDEPVAGPSWKQDVSTRMITRSKAQPRKPISDVSEKVSGQDNNWDFSPMLDRQNISKRRLIR